MKYKYYNAKMLQCSNDRQAVSLIMVMLIISTLLTAGLAVSDLIIRHARQTKSIEFSDLAYFAAESGVEKVVYKAFKEYCDISTANCQPASGGGATGYLWANGPEYTINQSDIVADTVSSPWLATVSAGRALQLTLDLNGATYPSQITVSQDGSMASDMTVWWCQTAASGPKICQTAATELHEFFYSTLPATITSISVPTYYYRIRINNRGAEAETYTFTFSGSLPIGLKINKAVGQYQGYIRQITSASPYFPKWQVFSAP